MNDRKKGEGDQHGTQTKDRETESGGKPSRRTSRGEHRYQFNLVSGTSAILVANAWKSGSNEDEFRFEYSTDGSSYTEAFIVSSTNTENEQSALLPAGTSGIFYVRVIDTDRQRGNRNIETINIDHLYVRVEGGSLGTVPIAPANLNAVASTGEIERSLFVIASGLTVTSDGPSKSESP